MLSVTDLCFNGILLPLCFKHISSSKKILDFLLLLENEL